jgi:hypothetical protein
MMGNLYNFFLVGCEIHEKKEEATFLGGSEREKDLKTRRYEFPIPPGRY